jgi:twinkle protein
MPFLTVKELQPRIDELYEHGLPRGDSTGWGGLDAYYRVVPGQWTLVTGIPGHGKSEWLDALMVSLAKNSKWRFAIFSPENEPLELHCAKIMEKIVGKPFSVGPTERISREEKDRAIAWMNARFGFVRSDAQDIISILNEASQWVQALEHSFKNGIVIDPWNELEHYRPSNLSEAEYISQTLRGVRRFVRDWNVHLWLVAHPKLMQKEKNGDYPVPTPYDISGGAQWRNKGDNIIAIWRDLEERLQTVEVYVQKVRFKHVGRIGMVQLRYDRVTGRYYDMTVK